MPRDYLTPAEYAALLDVAPSTVRMWIAKGILIAVRVGGRWRIPNYNTDQSSESKALMAAMKASGAALTQIPSTMFMRKPEPK